MFCPLRCLIGGPTQSLTNRPKSSASARPNLDEAPNNGFIILRLRLSLLMVISESNSMAQFAVKGSKPDELTLLDGAEAAGVLAAGVLLSDAVLLLAELPSHYKEYHINKWLNSRHLLTTGYSMEIWWEGYYCIFTIYSANQVLVRQS